MNGTVPIQAPPGPAQADPLAQLREVVQATRPDAPGVKNALRAAADPLALVVSGEIYQTIVRHGYDGIDPQAFRPLIRVQVAGHRYPGWVYTPGKTAQLHVAEIASYKQSA